MISKNLVTRAVLAVALVLIGAAVAPARIEPAGVTSTSDFRKLPLSFVPNAGQTDPAVRFQAQGTGNRGPDHGDVLELLLEHPDCDRIFSA